MCYLIHAKILRCIIKTALFYFKHPISPYYTTTAVPEAVDHQHIAALPQHLVIDIHATMAFAPSACALPVISEIAFSLALMSSPS